MIGDVDVIVMPITDLPVISRSLEICVHDPWAMDRLHRAIRAGIAESGKLWLEIPDVPLGTPRTFHWRALWGELSAMGTGPSEPEAFENLLRSLG